MYLVHLDAEEGNGGESEWDKGSNNRRVLATTESRQWNEEQRGRSRKKGDVK